MQAHLKAAQADAQPKLLKSMQIDNTVIVNELTGLQTKTKNKITNTNTDNMGKLFVMVFAFTPAPMTDL